MSYNLKFVVLMKWIHLQAIFINMETTNASGSVPVDESVDDSSETLLKIFEEGLDLYNNLGKIDEPTNSPPVQVLN